MKRWEKKKIGGGEERKENREIARVSNLQIDDRYSRGLYVERFNAMYTHALKLTRSARELIDRFVKTPSMTIDPKLPRALYPCIKFRTRISTLINNDRTNQTR